MWNWLLVKLRLRTDWTDPRNAPPFVPEVPHAYEEYSRVLTAVGVPPFDEMTPYLPCCKRCGGGSLHPIHHDKVTAAVGSKLSPELERMISGHEGQ